MDSLIFNTKYDCKTERGYFSNTNENLVNISFDNQGLFWSEDRREKTIKSLLNLHKGYRIMQITKEEAEKRKKFHETKTTDIFYQFKNFIGDLPLKYTHFQVRKNFYLLNGKEIAYSKRFGIQSYNIVTKKSQTLCALSSDDERDPNKGMICFDVIKLINGDYLICTGKCDGSVGLYKISGNEMRRVKDYKNNVVPKFDNFLSKVISFGDEVEVFTNYVKFLNKNGDIYLLTTSNDGNIRIFDLNDEMKLLNIYKNDSAVNNCDFNSTGDILGVVGDTQYVDIFDTKSNKKIKNFKAHYDYGIVLKFRPDSSNLFATGAQDFNCNIWDIRKIEEQDKKGKSVKTLCGFFDSIGDLLFTNDKKDNFLIFAENANYLHVYNLEHDTIQTLSYFGSLCGLAYDNDLSQIYLGYEENKPGILVYDMIKPRLENNFI